MGVPKLKIKVNLHYRKGTKARNCSGCQWYAQNHDIYGCDGKWRGVDHRCRVIGLNNSRRYRVHPDYVCDSHLTTDILS